MTELVNFNSLDVWHSLATQTQSKETIDDIYQEVKQVQQKWRNSFDSSVELWINFMFFKTQCLFKQLKTFKTSNDKEKIVEAKNSLMIFVHETQESVLKGLKNIQKLYLIPELRQKSISKSKETQTINQNKQKIRSLSGTKSRSTSHTSDNSRKPSAFRKNLFKATLQSNFKKDITNNAQKFTKSDNQNMVSKISKQFKPKPKFQNTGQLGSTALSKFSSEASKISSEMTQSISNYFTEKQKKKQDEIALKVTLKLQQKLKNIETDLNQKLNTIIQTIKTKSDPQTEPKKQNNPSERKTDKKYFQNNKNTEIDEESKISASLVSTNRQNIKRNSITKRITSNPIMEQKNQLETIALQKVISKSQFNAIETNLKDFIVFKKKVKLPIHDQLVRIFMSGYLVISSQLKIATKLQSLGFSDNQTFSIMEVDKCKAELKQCFLKMKKLLTLDSLSPKAQKIKAYIDQCLRCSYDLVLQQQYQIKQATSVQVQKLVAIL